MAERRYYLDTSAHIERHAGESVVRAELRKLLDGAEIATSTHVAREWKHIVEGGAVTILNACIDAASAADVRARIRNGFGRGPTHNAIALEMVEADGRDVWEIELRAEQFLRTRATALLEQGGIEVRDASECMLPRERAVRDPKSGKWKLRTQCRKDLCACEQIAFTDQGATQIDDAAEALAASAESGHRKMARIARDAMAAADKNRRKGQNCWGANGLGGDISIALECADDETLLTTDRSFEVMAPALPITVERFQGTRLP